MATQSNAVRFSRHVDVRWCGRRDRPGAV